mmetsp:Transcript_78365/g.229707  ORF Transcript_78365/g.229707 Transcript_78365/m.229707 type:complete len:238 (+) Transcript_78365:667-1380(+)
MRCHLGHGLLRLHLPAKELRCAPGLGGLLRPDRGPHDAGRVLPLLLAQRRLHGALLPGRAPRPAHGRAAAAGGRLLPPRRHAARGQGGPGGRLPGGILRVRDGDDVHEARAAHLLRHQDRSPCVGAYAGVAALLLRRQQGHRRQLEEARSRSAPVGHDRVHGDRVHLAAAGCRRRPGLRDGLCYGSVVLQQRAGEDAVRLRGVACLLGRAALPPGDTRFRRPGPWLHQSNSHDPVPH